VVDHPSVLNVIVNKVLGNETNKVRIDSILESFFAGCRKYDLYELAKKYYTISPNDLFQLQQAITSKELTKEQIEYSLKGLDNSAQVSSDGESINTIFNGYEQMGLYFDNDIPAKTSVDYDSLYDIYVSEQTKTYYKDQSPNTAEQTTSFFDSVIIPNKKKFGELIDEIDKQLTNNLTGIITIVINANASAAATNEYNIALSGRRIDSAITFITGNTKLTKYVTGTPQRLIVKVGGALGESAQPLSYDTKTTEFFPKKVVTCTDSDSQKKSKEIYTTNAMACRRAFIDTIDFYSPPAPIIPPKLVGTVVTTTETQNTLETQVVSRDNISKRVLRSLLSECDYFETIKQDTPMVYDNLRDKLKFFQPAFHSITPEGLNSRLTFLQQCMRPGDTIPTVKTVNGKITNDYENATNTSFGAPPVLVLRVGDFYNTKIIPKGLTLAYEDLDLNPEGIGVQPMIANVTLSFDFVGGSGLKESVDRLQNALTFNYYANTEMYDDRADATDLSYKVIDKDFLKYAIENGVQPPTLNQAAVQNGQNNNSTIGAVTSNIASGTSQTGTINYNIFMDKVVEETQTYFTNVVNKNKEALSQYNNAVRQQWMMERTYQDGEFLQTKATDTVLFGKPYNLEKRTDEIFTQLIEDIENENEGFIEFLKENKNDFTNRLINQVKDNYLNFVKNKKSVFQNAVTNIANGMVAVQQSYIGYIGRVNTITYTVPAYPGTGTDGYQIKDGKVVSYLISGTTEVNPSSEGVTNTFDELKNDVGVISSGITDFNTIIWSATSFVYKGTGFTGTLVFKEPNTVKTKDVFIPFSKNSLFGDTNKGRIFRRVYMIISDNITDATKYATFKDALIKNVIDNSDLFNKADNKYISKKFDEYWKDGNKDRVAVKPVFDEENAITKDFIENVMEKDRLKTFLKYTPFTLKKKRTFTYTTVGANTDSQQKLIKGLGATANQNTNNKTWNDENSTDVFISKAKLN
jgi:outer membrane protein OmpA-like peptidoglycan-associated protein